MIQARSSCDPARGSRAASSCTTTGSARTREGRNATGTRGAAETRSWIGLSRGWTPWARADSFSGRTSTTRTRRTILRRGGPPVPRPALRGKRGLRGRLPGAPARRPVGPGTAVRNGRGGGRRPRRVSRGARRDDTRRVPLRRDAARAPGARRSGRQERAPGGRAGLSRRSRPDARRGGWNPGRAGGRRVALAARVGRLLAAPPGLRGERFYPAALLHWSPIFAVRTAQAKYVEAPKPELYELGKDAGERENLFALEHPDARALARELSAIRASAVPARAAAGNGESVSRLTSLGYLTPSGPAWLCPPQIPAARTPRTASGHGIGSSAPSSRGRSGRPGGGRRRAARGGRRQEDSGETVRMLRELARPAYSREGWCGDRSLRAPRPGGCRRRRRLFRLGVCWHLLGRATEQRSPANRRIALDPSDLDGPGWIRPGSLALRRLEASRRALEAALLLQAPRASTRSPVWPRSRSSSGTTPKPPCGCTKRWMVRPERVEILGETCCRSERRRGERRRGPAAGGRPRAAPGAHAAFGGLRQSFCLPESDRGKIRKEVVILLPWIRADGSSARFLRAGAGRAAWAARFLQQPARCFAGHLPLAGGPRTATLSGTVGACTRPTAVRCRAPSWPRRSTSRVAFRLAASPTPRETSGIGLLRRAITP